MNIQESDILNALMTTPYCNQRALAERSGHSLGIVNRSVNALIRDGYLNQQIQPTEKAIEEFRSKAPKNAIILAAGFGMRMVPINTETPKGLLEVHGEPLVERLIRQLHEVGIREIYVVVGFMKEQYEYLIDEYGVELIVNAEYARKNNLHSLSLALEHLSNSYVVPCDIWCAQNPFHSREPYSWYLVSDQIDSDSSVRVNRKMELVSVPDGAGGNAMLGVAYLLEDQAAFVRRQIRLMVRDTRHDGAFWEEALFQKDRMVVASRVIHAPDVVEINTYEQLRELDGDSGQLKSEAIDAIAGALQADPMEITDITVLKKGMTNRSFRFSCHGREYIMRIPGEGTDQLIDRQHEAAVYHVISGRGICDNVAYISPETGYKITEFLSPARVCDPMDPEDVRRCMEKLRAFHETKLKVDHEFNLFRQIEFYEHLWNGTPSIYKDHTRTRQNVFSLRPYIEAHAEQTVLTHIDAVPDNFLFVTESDGRESLRLIDWEYAGMQDPHVDLAMFCIYAMYNRQQIDQLIDTYFVQGCTEATRAKIYCYIAVCGLLWSDWCEYKRLKGVEFGEYSLRQYRYAKDYYRVAQEAISRLGGETPCSK